MDQLQRAEIQLQSEYQALKADNENLRNSLQQTEKTRDKGTVDRDNMELHIKKLEQENHRSKNEFQALQKSMEYMTK